MRFRCPLFQNKDIQVFRFTEFPTVQQKKLKEVIIDQGRLNDNKDLIDY